MPDPTANHQPALGIFGGTFDPAHWGHIRPVQEAAAALGLTQVFLIPNREPVHKAKASASTEQRLAMLTLICQNEPLFQLDLREINRQQKSYSLFTLQELAKQYPQQRIYFFIGMDSLLDLTRWYGYQQLFDYCHFVVTRRPGFELDLNAIHPVTERILENPRQVPPENTGKILIFDTNQVDISSTEIRQKIRNGEDVAPYMPTEVAHYIQQQKLYQ